MGQLTNKELLEEINSSDTISYFKPLDKADKPTYIVIMKGKGLEIQLKECHPEGLFNGIVLKNYNSTSFNNHVGSWVTENINEYVAEIKPTH